MGQFGGFYKGDKKKLKKIIIDKKATIATSRSTFVLPQVVIIKKGKHEK